MTFDEWFELKKEKCEVYGNGDDFCVDDEIKHFCKMAWDEQQKQIEKMKCCQNCKFEDNDCIEEPCSVCTRCLGNLKRKGNSDKWEIKEIC